MANEVRQRKKPEKDLKSDSSVEKKPVVEKNVEKRPKKMGWWTYFISPLLATMITLSTNTFLDGQISLLENQLLAVGGRVEHMDKIWSAEIAEGIMKEVNALNVTFIVARDQIKEYVTGEFTDFGDPILIKEEIATILEGIRKIKAQEDEHYKVLAQERKQVGKMPTLMEHLTHHRKALIGTTKVVKEAFDDHTTAIEDNELGAEYVNLTSPVQELRTEISSILDQCREMGAKRFIATHLMEHLDGQLDEAISKVKRGDFNDIPDPIQQSAELWPIFEEFTLLRKDIRKYDNFSQTIRDKFETIADNERFGKAEHIKLSDQYGTPKEYEAKINRMKEYAKMPSMKELVAVAKGVEKTASDMYVVGCQEDTRRVMTGYRKAIGEQQKRVDALIKQAATAEWRAAFEEKLVKDIQKRQEGLERFIMRMKYQLIDAEEKWATTYYHFLQAQKHELTKADSHIEIVGDTEGRNPGGETQKEKVEAIMQQKAKAALKAEAAAAAKKESTPEAVLEATPSAEAVDA